MTLRLALEITVSKKHTKTAVQHMIVTESMPDFILGKLKKTYIVHVSYSIEVSQKKLHVCYFFFTTVES